MDALQYYWSRKEQEVKGVGSKMQRLRFLKSRRWERRPPSMGHQSGTVDGL